LIAEEAGMPARTVGFAIAADDQARLDRLVARFGNGNRSEFLRQAIRIMSVQDRAERLRSIQSRAHDSVGRVLTADEVNELIKKTLADAASA
jgi:Arc/MetJ-type ribon-helix-helix transcriptional regulator